MKKNKLSESQIVTMLKESEAGSLGASLSLHDIIATLISAIPAFIKNRGIMRVSRAI